MNFLLDGGDNNDSFSNVNLPIPFPDAIQEFSVQTNGLPAQYGLSAFQSAGSNAACTTFSGQFGNLGRNAIYGPGQMNFDLALSRKFVFNER